MKDFTLSKWLQCLAALSMAMSTNAMAEPTTSPANAIQVSDVARSATQDAARTAITETKSSTNGETQAWLQWIRIWIRYHAQVETNRTTNTPVVSSEPGSYSDLLANVTKKA